MRDTGYKYGLKKPCLGGVKCKHVKCECGHCDSYHLWHWECQQLDRKTLTVCPCKKFSPSETPTKD